MKKQITLLFSLFLGSVAFSQSSSGWSDLNSDKGVSLSYQVTTCNEKDFILFKIENASNEAHTTFYSVKIKDQNGQTIMMLPARPVTTIANTTDSGDCSVPTSEFCRPLPQATSYVIELVDFSVK